MKPGMVQAVFLIDPEDLYPVFKITGRITGKREMYTIQVSP
jgi:hypothetical protein